MTPRYISPYTVDQIINPRAVQLKFPAALKVHPAFHVSLLKPILCALQPTHHHPPVSLMATQLTLSTAFWMSTCGARVIKYGPEEHSWVSLRPSVVDWCVLVVFFCVFTCSAGKCGGGGGLLWSGFLGVFWLCSSTCLPAALASVVEAGGLFP